MLVSFDSTGRVLWVNDEIAEADASPYLSEETVWMDTALPESLPREGYQQVLYVNQDKKSVRVDYEPITEPEPDMNDIYSAVSKTQDELRQEGADSVMEEMQKRGLIV